jgi:hypothetical protein
MHARTQSQRRSKFENSRTPPQRPSKLRGAQDEFYQDDQMSVMYGTILINSTKAMTNNLVPFTRRDHHTQTQILLSTNAGGEGGHFILRYVDIVCE